ncbi:MAG TPA: aryl-sulfate sulfotransferase, partial [Candidatus Bathyarchaeia archaeon]|nr:aryl-sulfate sulfotransferase [Candidatus Bathyarchaeia archaeon]
MTALLRRLRGASPDSGEALRVRARSPVGSGRLLPAACLTILLATSACTRSDPTPAQPAEVRQETIDRLRALAYTDVSDETAEPAKLGVVRLDPTRAYPGYNLFTNAHLCSTELTDLTGTVVHSWSYTPCDRWDNTVLLPQGDLLVVGAIPENDKSSRTPGDGTSAPGVSSATDPEGKRYLMRLRWDGSVLWQKYMLAHHDAEPTPRGELVFLTFMRRHIAERNPEDGMRDDYLAVASPNGDLIDQVSLYDLLNARPELFKFQPVTVTGEGSLLHANSVEWMHDENLARGSPLYSLSNVLVCIRHQDTIAIVNWDRRELVWAWGQGNLSGPHDATVLADGHILVFDNGLGRNWSRAVEMDPLTRRIVWEYRAEPRESVYTRTRGSSQRLPNGNTLIAVSDT